MKKIWLRRMVVYFLNVIVVSSHAAAPAEKGPTDSSINWLASQSKDMDAVALDLALFLPASLAEIRSVFRENKIDFKAKPVSAKLEGDRIRIEGYDPSLRLLPDATTFGLSVGSAKWRYDEKMDFKSNFESLARLLREKDGRHAMSPINLLIDKAHAQAQKQPQATTQPQPKPEKQENEYSRLLKKRDDAWDAIYIFGVAAVFALSARAEAGKVGLIAAISAAIASIAASMQVVDLDEKLARLRTANLICKNKRLYLRLKATDSKPEQDFLFLKTNWKDFLKVAPEKVRSEMSEDFDKIEEKHCVNYAPLTTINARIGEAFNVFKPAPKPVGVPQPTSPAPTTTD